LRVGWGLFGWLIYKQNAVNKRHNGKRKAQSHKSAYKNY